ncbi:serine/threonine-protein kinase/endoribonuclease ire-1-like [Daphnia carinata]|uniref:serine/threonine-protein kinase/endoribonuclease ire-1-like n=1 Tax=Daphnia carinata TaxID=120202 RepID=UPI00257DECD2|nr:serine/threonine-protein kinase/endoribonuclease ire-1-like [Daphnia carinata]
MTGKHIGAIWLDTTNPRSLLGEGQYSAIYLGKLNGSTNVAIKVIEVEDQPDEKYNQLPEDQPDAYHNQMPGQMPAKQRSNRMNEVLGRLKHPNVIKLLGVEEEDSIKYFALELCAATLDQYCRGLYTGPMPREEDVLLQMISGLRYVHSEKYVHRNIEPKNILISKFPIRIILSDFALSKPIDPNGSLSVSKNMSINQGRQLCWLAPEMLDNPDDPGFSEKRGSIASDTFSAGCVIFYYLTLGLHPFGSDLHFLT